MNKEESQRQENNTAKLVMSTFYKLGNKDGTTAEDVARYLQDKFGDVWRLSSLVNKAEDTLKRSVALGFLDRRGSRYITKIAREMGCCKRKSRRRRRRHSRCRRSRCRRSRCRRRKRRSCGRRRRRRRRKSCSCGK